MTSMSAVGAVILGLGSYSALKAMVEAMTKLLAKELKGTEITHVGFLASDSGEWINRLTSR